FVSPIFTAAPAPNLFIPTNYNIDSTCIQRIHITEKGVKAILVAHAPILITARLKDVDEGMESLRLSWKRSINSWRHKIVNRDLVFDSRQIVTLAGNGFPVGSDTAREVITYLQAF